MKLCRSCGSTKPLTDFYADRTKRLRVGTYCRTCCVIKAAVAYEVRKALPKSNPASKVCGTCQTDKPAAQYWRQSSALDGLQPECKDCRGDRSRMARYGMERGEFDRLVIAQGGTCAICPAATDLVVDHDHTTGAVRGALCSNCNTALGLLGDSPDRLLAAITYLSITKETPSCASSS